MNFHDPHANGPGVPGVQAVSGDGRWRVTCADLANRETAEWHVWQYLGGPPTDPKSYQRRVPWTLLPDRTAAEAVASVLARLPYTASPTIVRRAVSRVLRGVGAAALFRGIVGAHGLATRLRDALAARQQARQHGNEV